MVHSGYLLDSTHLNQTPPVRFWATRGENERWSIMTTDESMSTLMHFHVVYFNVCTSLTLINAQLRQNGGASVYFLYSFKSAHIKVHLRYIHTSYIQLNTNHFCTNIKCWIFYLYSSDLLYFCTDSFKCQRPALVRLHQLHVHQSCVSTCLRTWRFRFRCRLSRLVPRLVKTTWLV